MMGTINCIYETPCGWCSKWDKKCDKKIPDRGQRVKSNPVDDATDALISNEMCIEESDHEWECCGMSTEGTVYICKKCYTKKIYPHKLDDNIYVTI